MFVPFFPPACDATNEFDVSSVFSHLVCRLTREIGISCRLVHAIDKASAEDRSILKGHLIKSNTDCSVSIIIIIIVVVIVTIIALGHSDRRFAQNIK